MRRGRSGVSFLPGCHICGAEFPSLGEMGCPEHPGGVCGQGIVEQTWGVRDTGGWGGSGSALGVTAGACRGHGAAAEPDFSCSSRRCALKSSPPPRTRCCCW